MCRAVDDLFREESEMRGFGSGEGTFGVVLQEMVVSGVELGG